LLFTIWRRKGLTNLLGIEEVGRNERPVGRERQKEKERENEKSVGRQAG